ncbi:MAG: hypothetical protein N2043_02125 [Ignavibacterium sp.]|nr:hypothetical protein [Ignavibacterium sp.]
MADLQDEILFLTWHLSGGNNANPDMSLGGEISPYVIDFDSGTELFSPMNFIECEKGVVKYRCIFVKNNSFASDIKNGKIWIDLENVEGGGQSFELGIEPPKSTTQLLNDEKQAPNGVVFKKAVGETNGIPFEINAQEIIPIWVKVTVEPGTEYYRANLVIRIKGTVYL